MLVFHSTIYQWWINLQSIRIEIRFQTWDLTTSWTWKEHALSVQILWIEKQCSAGGIRTGISAISVTRDPATRDPVPSKHVILLLLDGVVDDVSSFHHSLYLVSLSGVHMDSESERDRVSGFRLFNCQIFEYDNLWIEKTAKYYRIS